MGFGYAGCKTREGWGSDIVNAKKNEIFNLIRNGSIVRLQMSSSFQIRASGSYDHDCEPDCEQAQPKAQAQDQDPHLNTGCGYAGRET